MPRNEREAGDEPEELKVFISHRASVCGECREELGHDAWVFLAGDRGALCLSCADLDHLVFLPAGDTAVTRRARNLSTLSAVVLRWSRARTTRRRGWRWWPTSVTGRLTTTRCWPAATA